MPEQTFQDFIRSPFIATVTQQLDVNRLLQNAIAIQQIPAPTFHEARRAAFIKEQFGASSLHDVSIDHVHNVYGRWPGTNPALPALLVSAHLDTVFAADTDLTVRHTDDRVYGPGLGDNSLGVAALLALLDSFSAHNIHPKSDIWLVANTREEGLGNLEGIRAVWDTLQNRLGAAIVLEGMSLGHIYHAGIAVRRLHIVCHAPGGHSWQHFGNTSAIHGLIAIGSRILALTPPRHPRTTYNIGLIHGGQTVNSLATEAELYLDLRSENPSALAHIENQVRKTATDVQRPDLSVTIEVVGDRPAGCIPTDHPLVKLATAAVQAVGLPPTFEAGSTDANLLLSQGLPTVTVGVTSGGHAHRPDEFIETGPLHAGLKHLVLMILAAANGIWG